MNADHKDDVIEAVSRPTRPANDEDNTAAVLLRWFIQVVGLAAAIIFGTFSICSWVNSLTAKQQADTANLLALTSLCAQLQYISANEQTEQICAAFLAAAIPSLNAALASVLPSNPARSYTTYPSSTPQTTLVTSAPQTSSGSLGASTTSPASLTSSNGVSLSSVTTTATSTSASATDPIGGSPGGGSSAPAGARAALSTYDRVAIGVGLGVGIPLLIVTVLTYLAQRRQGRAFG